MIALCRMGNTLVWSLKTLKNHLILYEVNPDNHDGKDVKNAEVLGSITY